MLDHTELKKKKKSLRNILQRNHSSDLASSTPGRRAPEPVHGPPHAPGPAGTSLCCLSLHQPSTAQCILAGESPLSHWQPPSPDPSNTAMSSRLRWDHASASQHLEPPRTGIAQTAEGVPWHLFLQALVKLFAGRVILRNFSPFLPPEILSRWVRKEQTLWMTFSETLAHNHSPG